MVSAKIRMWKWSLREYVCIAVIRKKNIPLSFYPWIICLPGRSPWYPGPTFDHLVEAGLLSEREMGTPGCWGHGEDYRCSVSHILGPTIWALVDIRKARYAGYISSEIVFSKLQESLQVIVVKNQKLLSYGWMNIPLVYTQLATIAVHVSILGQQYLTHTHCRNTGGNLTKVTQWT